MLAGIFLWFYVMITTENPVSEVGIGGVQLEARGAAPGLSVELVPGEVMVAVTGPRRAVSRLSGEDVKAWVNLTNMGPGKRRVRPQATVRGGFGVRVKKSTVLAILRESSKKTLPVEIELIGLPSGYAPGRLSSKPAEIQVEGNEGAVARVARVTAEVNVRSGQDFRGEVEPTAVDARGRVVKAVQLRPAKVWVEVPLTRAVSARVVPVVVRTSGAAARGFKVTGASATPAVATVTGQRLDDIAYVETTPLPLRGVTSDIRVKLPLIRPSQASSVVPDQVDVSISIERR